MSQTSREPQPTATSRDDAFARLDAPLPASERSPSGAWQGWAYFGAAVMAMMGLFWALLGFIALFDDTYFVVRTNSLLAVHTFAPWGWVHLLGGLVAVAAGAGIMWSGHRWSRVLGIVVAGLSAVVNL